MTTHGARIPSATELTALIAQWTEWLSSRTDSLLSLEERVKSAGNPSDAADLAAAFVCRKAITDRLEQVAVAAQRDRAAASALTAQPVLDDLGGLVGNNLTEAAELLDGVLQRVEHSVAGREALQLGEASTAAQVDADLSVAERLSAELGLQVNHVGQLREAFNRRERMAETSIEAATVRASLEAAARERASLLSQWQAAPARLQALTADEAGVRELAARCRAKVVQAPPLAVPSVAAISASLGDLQPTDLDSLPWATVRGRIGPLLLKIDRVAAALAEAERRFQAVLDRRDELRGLLHGFADKAAAHGVIEEPRLDALYQEAKAVLWAAPCDVDRGAALVDQYVAMVNTTLKGVAR